MTTSYSSLPILKLKPNRDRSLRDRHPWVFSGAITQQSTENKDGSLKDGVLVRVLAHSGEFLAIGHYYSSSIMFKALSFKERDIDLDFWREKLLKAISLREIQGLSVTTDVENLSDETTAFRLVHGEGDGLPGLIVDLYGSCAVIQTQTSGMLNHLEDISLALKDVLASRLTTIFHQDQRQGGGSTTGDKKDGTEVGALPEAHTSATDPNKGRYLLGSSKDCPGRFRESGITFEVNWETGQKTGFFLDQRDNRFLVGQYAAGRKVLNAFCYTGGFSLAALLGGATSVDSVDVSQPALEQLERNLALNITDASITERHRIIKAGCFKFLETAQDTYEMIILDPPAFIKHKNALERGLKGYQALHELALKRLAPNGILATFSCSQLLSQQDFKEVIRRAAAKVGRDLSVIAQLTQSGCHPVNIFHPEGAYLKGVLGVVL